MGWTAAIITAIIAYIIGSLNASIIISKVFLKEDIRNSGSGNAGATNMLRTYGKKMAIATLLFDVFKGVVAVILAGLVDKLLPGSLREGASFANSHLLGNLGYIAGLFVALGHNFPIFFGFKGGKGVATGIGVIFALNPAIGAIVLVVAISIMAITRIVSLGSIIGAALFPLLLLAFGLGKGSFSVVSIVIASLLALLVIVRHHSNIKRLINGTENKLGERKK